MKTVKFRFSYGIPTFELFLKKFKDPQIFLKFELTKKKQIFFCDDNTWIKLMKWGFFHEIHRIASQSWRGVKCKQKVCIAAKHVFAHRKLRVDVGDLVKVVVAWASGIHSFSISDTITDWVSWTRNAECDGWRAIPRSDCVRLLVAVSSATAAKAVSYSEFVEFLKDRQIVNVFTKWKCE